MTKSGTGARMIEYAVPPALRPSVLGIASFAVAIAAVGTMLAVFVAITGRPASDPMAYKLFGLSLILPVVGTVFGIVSLCQRRTYRGLAVAGLTINVVLTLLVLLAAVPSLLHQLMDQAERTFHTRCTAHADARACWASGFTPWSFSCPFARRDCLMRPFIGRQFRRRRGSRR